MRFGHCVVVLLLVLGKQDASSKANPIKIIEYCFVIPSKIRTFQQSSDVTAITLSQECTSQSRSRRVPRHGGVSFSSLIIKNITFPSSSFRSSKMMEHQEEDEEKESFLPLDVVVVDRQEPRPRRAMSSRLPQLRGLKRVPFLKLEFWSSPKVLGGVSLAWVVILVVYLVRLLVIVCSSISPHAKINS